MRSAALSTLICLLLVFSLCACHRSEPQSKTKSLPPEQSTDPRGYTLFAPSIFSDTYLIDSLGHLVNSWRSEYQPGQSAYLLENGHLLRTASLGPDNHAFRTGGAGGRIEEFSWHGELVWEFEYANDKHYLHHDIAPMSNGHILMIAWERKSAEEAIAAGRDPSIQGMQDWWCDHVLEVEPTPPKGGKIVWEWHVADHLIQDRDPQKPHYDEITRHPERIDANWEDWVGTLSPEQRGQLEAVGYLGPAAQSDPDHMNPDWTHTNAISYNEDLDQIMLSVLGFNEVWIIDHSSSTAEAAGSTGGRSGRGGDLLYRWGNPQTYGRGGPEDQRLFAQHDAHWIPEGLPGEGHMLVFNNGRGRPEGEFSTVEEIALPSLKDGRYVLEEGHSFGPEAPLWRYEAPEKTSFYSHHISGAQRLSNGNTLICEGAKGTFFEVQPDGMEVWRYRSPIQLNMPGPPMGGPPGLPPLPFNPPPPAQGPQMPWRPPQRDPFPGGPPHPPGPQNDVFRAYRYEASYPGLAGKDLRPGPLLDENTIHQSPPRSGAIENAAPPASRLPGPPPRQMPQAP